MYTTCLFCNRPLGQNEAIETFPVQTVQDAVEQIEPVGDPMEFLSRVPHDMDQRDRSKNVSQIADDLLVSQEIEEHIERLKTSTDETEA